VAVAQDKRQIQAQPLPAVLGIRQVFRHLKVTTVVMAHFMLLPAQMLAAAVVAHLQLEAQAIHLLAAAMAATERLRLFLDHR
jgi:hypothetical protein